MVHAESTGGKRDGFLVPRRISVIVKTGPNRGEIREHSFCVVECCRHPVKGGTSHTPADHLVEVWRSSDSGHAFFGNVKRCGSVWTCPICAARITEKKRKELQAGSDNWIAKGGKAFLVTFTIPHHGGHQTAVWRDQLLSAYRKMRNRTPWRKWATSASWRRSGATFSVQLRRSGRFELSDIQAHAGRSVAENIPRLFASYAFGGR